MDLNQATCLRLVKVQGPWTKLFLTKPKVPISSILYQTKGKENVTEVAFTGHCRNFSLEPSDPSIRTSMVGKGTPSLDLSL